MSTLFLIIMIVGLCFISAIIALSHWKEDKGKLPKSILSLFLCSIGILLVGHICSHPASDFPANLIIWLIIGFIFVLIASLIASELLYLKLKTARKNVFAAIFIIVLLFLSFGSAHNSLYPFITRIGQSGIVPDTEIVTKEDIYGGITPREAIEIADCYLRSPIEANNTYYWDIIENHPKKATGTYTWDIYKDYWMKKVVVSAVSWDSINKYNPNIRWKLSNLTDVPYKNESLYMVTFYFNSVLHKEDNELMVYIDKDGNVIGTSTYILE